MILITIETFYNENNFCFGETEICSRSIRLLDPDSRFVKQSDKNPKKKVRKKKNEKIYIFFFLLWLLSASSSQVKFFCILQIIKFFCLKLLIIIKKKKLGFQKSSSSVFVETATQQCWVFGHEFTWIATQCAHYGVGEWFFSVWRCFIAVPWQSQREGLATPLWKSPTHLKTSFFRARIFSTFCTNGGEEKFCFFNQF